MAFKGKIPEETRQKAIDSVMVDGLNYRQAGAKHGITGTTLRGWVDPEYAAKRTAAIKARRAERPDPRPSRARRKRPAPTMPAAP